MHLQAPKGVCKRETLNLAIHFLACEQDTYASMSRRQLQEVSRSRGLKANLKVWIIFCSLPFPSLPNRLSEARFVTERGSDPPAA